MIQNKLSQAADHGGSKSHPHPGQCLPVQDDTRDINRLNADGHVYSGYHVNHDAHWTQRPRTTGGMA